MRKIILILVLLLVLGSFAAVNFLPMSGDKVIFNVPQGSNARTVARSLQQQGLVRWSWGFLFLAKVTGKTASLRAGSYELSRGNVWCLLQDLTTPSTLRRKITLPEGWNAWQMAQRLHSAGIIENADFFCAYVRQHQLEGYLFPDTYFFAAQSSPQDIVQHMRARLNNVYQYSWQQRAETLGLTQHQVLTLASILEREVKEPSERARVAGVYHNRLRKNMLLESCPTVQYALSDGKEWKESLTYADLKISSPFNTYRNKGLPPGPICSPGREAIYAALYPETHAYLFFVADRRGKHYFAQTYAQHLRWRAVSKRNFGI